MAFELDVSDAERRLLRVAGFSDLAVGPVKDVLRDMAQALRAAELAAIVSGAPSGRIYRRGRRRFRSNRAGNVKGGIAIAFHRASAPGQPPASDSGGLARSLAAAVAAPAGKSVSASVRSKAFYGFMLESGTVRIRPRPSLVPEARKMTDEFVSRIQAVLDEAAGKVSA